MTRLAVGVALLCAGFVAGLLVATARADGTVSRLQAENRRLAGIARTVDTAYVTDTLTLTRTRVRTDSVLTVDTLIHRDTVKVLVEAERLACDAALSTCEVRVAVRDSQIAVLDSALTVALRRPRLSKHLFVASDLKGGVYVGGEVRARVFGLELFGRGETRIDSASSQLRGGLIFRF